MRKLLLTVTVLALAGCVTGEDEAMHTLQNQGLTQIEVQGWDLFECGEHDKTGRAFIATNANGARVSGTVCCGILKGCTVRW